MKKLKIGMKIGLGFGLIFVLMAILSIVTHGNVKRMELNAEETFSTMSILGDLNLFEGHLTNAETGQRGYLVTGLENYLEPYNHAMNHVEEHILELKLQIHDEEEETRLLRRLEVLARAKMAELAMTIKMVEDKGIEAARKEMSKGEGKQIMDDIRQVVGQMRAQEERHLQKNLLDVELRTARTRRIILWIGGLSLLIVILLTYYFVVTIAQPLQRATIASKKIAEGDLNVELEETKRSDEVGLLVKSLITMKNVLHTQISEIKEGVGVLSSSTSEIMSGVSQLAASATQTATAIGQTTTTIEEVKQTAEVSSYKAKEVSAEGKKNAMISEEGNKAVIETTESMAIIKQKMDTIANVVLNLSELSHSIGEITATVNDLAEQSNILAVNAAIEAAKAGDQGRGFAVVAQEIKNLSYRSKEATSEVRSILNEVQKSISKVVMSTEDGGRVVATGLDLIKATREAIEMLSSSVTRASQASIQIASSSQQQLIGIDQVVVAMENIRESSSQIATTTQQTSISVNNLHQLGERLQNLIDFYKVSK
jgi:methyl-accepting chemotaxis protein